ncbi:MAG: DUF4388 domain-containing protein [Thermodesulfovibrionales bacterium]
MALEGSLRDFGLADILQLLYFQKKTGTLTISSPMDRVILYFLDGNIVSAESKKRTEDNRFGRILIKKGVINEKELQEALQEQKKTGMRVGDILAKKGILSQDVIRETIVSQLTETVIQLFSWKDGNYEFKAQQVSLSKEIPVSLDTQHLLMEGLRILDEWTLIGERLTLDTVFKRTGAVDSITQEESNILNFVDGENDVSMITELTGMDNFEVSKILLSLMDRGLIEPVAVEPVITEPAEVIIAKKRDLSILLPLGAILIGLTTSFFIYAIKSPFGEDIISSWLESSKITRVEEDIERLRFKTDLYRLKTGSNPLRIDDIGGGRDAWGNAYYYEVKGDNLIIISPGPDGKIGTADDIY